jgi:predicted secreted protein
VKSSLAAAVLLALFMAAGCTSSHHHHPGGKSCITEAQIEYVNEITVKAGEIFTIELPGNPTTGYTWNVQFCEDSPLLLETQEFIQENLGTVGSGGIFMWNFRAAKLGSCSLHFTYRRPWETVTPIDEHIFLVNVEQGVK